VVETEQETLVRGAGGFAFPAFRALALALAGGEHRANFGPFAVDRSNSPRPVSPSSKIIFCSLTL